MTDYRSLELLEVNLCDQRVGELRRTPNGCIFEYDAEYLATTGPSVAYSLPKQEPLHEVRGLLNLPTYFAGLLPEGVMFEAAQRMIGSSRDDLFAILAATGIDAVGDVQIRVPGENSKPSILTLGEARDAISDLLNVGKVIPHAVKAISGVQPKFSIGRMMRSHRSPEAIAKFPPPQFPNLPRNELACMQLAKRCGLLVPHVDLKDGVFVIERFDRVKGRKRHVEDLLQLLDRYPRDKYLFEFADLCDHLQTVNISLASMLQIIQQFVFSYIIGNGDLHAKNLSLIRLDDDRWVPSPVYDLVSTLPYSSQIAGADRMAIALVDEQVGHFELSDFVEFGARYRLPEAVIRRMISKLCVVVLRDAPDTLIALGDEVLEVVLSRARNLMKVA